MKRNSNHYLAEPWPISSPDDSDLGPHLGQTPSQASICTCENQPNRSFHWLQFFNPKLQIYGNSWMWRNGAYPPPPTLLKNSGHHHGFGFAKQIVKTHIESVMLGQLFSFRASTLNLSQPSRSSFYKRYSGQHIFRRKPTIRRFFQVYSKLT